MTYNEIKNLDLTEEASSADESDNGQVHGNRSNQQQNNRPRLQLNLLQTAGNEDLNKQFN